MAVERKKRILLVSPSEISQDPRVLSHLEVLQEYGDVTTIGYGDSPDGVKNHLTINRSASFLPRSIKGLLKASSGFAVAAAMDTEFSKSALRIIDSEVYDLVVANDVHALAVGHSIAELHHAKFWADMHEYAPLQGQHDWKWMIAFQRYVASLCKRYLKAADCVTTVSQGIKEKYEEDLGREVLLLRNSAHYLPRSLLAETKPNIEDNLFSLIHVGVAIRARLLENMIEAVRGLDGVKLDLLVLPTDTKYFCELSTMSKEISNVQMLSPISTNEVTSFISKYQCGLVTIPPTNFNYANCLPNKLFQYIQARLAIITGPIPEIAGIVEDFGLGWVVPDFSVESIRRTILQAKEDGVSNFVNNLDRAAEELSKEKESTVRHKIVTRLLFQS